MKELSRLRRQLDELTRAVDASRLVGAKLPQHMLVAKQVQHTLEAYGTHVRRASLSPAQEIADQIVASSGRARLPSRPEHLGRSLAAEFASLAQLHVADRLGDQAMWGSARSLSDLIATANPSLPTIDQAVTHMLDTAFGPLKQSLGTSLVREMHDQLVAAAANDDAADDAPSPVISIATAMLRAVAKQAATTDWRFVLGLIVTLLVFLYQDREGEAVESRLSEQIALVEARQRAYEHLFELMLSKTIARPVTLRTRPKLGAGGIATLEIGQGVLLLERRGKWARVAVIPDDSTSAQSQTGWVMNKYLK